LDEKGIQYFTARAALGALFTQAALVMNCAIYCRVSTSEQENENQLIQLNEYCQRQGWTITKIYKDTVSGIKTNRPAFDQLFIDAHKLQFDTLLFWSLSRFSRSGTLFTLIKLNELSRLNIGWHSFTEPYFSSVGLFKDTLISIMATLAQIEREQISERTKAGLQRIKLNAQKNGIVIKGRGKDKKKRKRRFWKKLKI